MNKQKMNLLDFEEYDLYFDEPGAEEVTDLLQTAAESYAEGKA
ncbi:MAG: hypothetical protein Kow0060_10860 [Methylohalobius crimeensis]